MINIFRATEKEEFNAAGARVSGRIPPPASLLRFRPAKIVLFLAVPVVDCAIARLGKRLMLHSRTVNG